MYFNEDDLFVFVFVDRVLMLKSVGPTHYYCLFSGDYTNQVNYFHL